VALGERRRSPLTPRSTAEAVTALRAAGALEKDPAVRCPDEMAAGLLGRFNIVNLAKYRATRGLVLRMANRRIPGTYTYEIARTKFIDEVVLDAVAAGLDELILLGAGFDSRPYRLTAQLEGVRVMEVDHPASQATKRERIRRLLGQEPDHVAYVPIDFTTGDLDATLAAAGHDRSARTLFVWSGVSPYLPEEAVAEVLSWVGGRHGPGTSIVFDAIWAEVVDGSRDYYGAAEFRKGVAENGEPARWGIPEGRVDETLSRFGLEVERALDEEEGRATYLKRSDGTLLDRPCGFGVLLLAGVARG
jgi:methyltransferase (TIGR00027 family)